MKTILMVTAVLIGTQAFAQFEKGRMLVGGTALFSVTQDKSKVGNTSTVTGTNVNFDVSPQFGYFIMDHFAVGGFISSRFSSFKDKNSSSNYRSNSSGYTIGPMARYYFDPGFFAQLGVGIGGTSYHTKSSTISQNYSYLQTQLRIGAGYAFFLTKNTALEPMISYEVSSSKQADTDPKQKNTVGGIYLRAGFQIYLR